MTLRQVATKPLPSLPRQAPSMPPSSPRPSVPRPDGVRSRAPLKFRPSPAAIQPPRLPSVVRPVLTAPPPSTRPPARERVDPRARTLLATPAPAAAALAPLSRRLPPPLPQAKAEHLDTLPDAELTELLDASDMLDDADLIDEEPGATTRTTPPPAPSAKPSRKAWLAVVTGVVVSVAGVAVALFLQSDSLEVSNAAARIESVATLDSPAVSSAASPPAPAALAAPKAPKAHAANKPAPKAKAKAKAPRASAKRVKPPAPRAAAKKPAKAPSKK